MIHLIIILSLSILTDYLLIKGVKWWSLPSYKGWYKGTVLAVFYAAAAAVIVLQVDGWDFRLVYAAASAAIWMPAKNIAMGLILHHDPFYLGTGRWDQLWRNWPPILLLFQFLFAGGLFTLTLAGTLTPAKWFFFGFYVFIFLVLVIVQWFKK